MHIQQAVFLIKTFLEAITEWKLKRNLYSKNNFSINYILTQSKGLEFVKDKMRTLVRQKKFQLKYEAYFF